MKTMRYAAIVFFGFYLILNSILTYGQADPMARSIKERFNMYGNTALQEKMYVHLDRSFYLIGETIWFKAYNLDGAHNRFLDMSKVAYLEVLDKDNNAVIQTKFSLSAGKGNGSVSIPSAIASGNYKVRGYTSWMKNFGPEYYFETDISIVNPFVRFDPAPDAERELSYDVQFFPEGGYLVKNMESKVAFRATAPDGKGISFRGVVIDQRNDTLVRFQPSRFGIGNFMLKPESTDSLRVVITDSRGRQFNYALPKVMQRGYVMHVSDAGTGQVKVTVNRAGFEEPGDAYILAHTKQLNPLSDKLVFEGNKAEFNINRADLGEGISHLTILNEKLKPVCERLYFKRPEKMLTLDAKVGKADFTTREKVTLDLSAGQASNLSVSVFLSDSIKGLPQEDIASYFLLTSDLQGQVEDPSYYFRNVSSQTDQDLDNVMISHGWRRFKWENVFGASVPKYEFLPEYDGHLVFGKVLNTSDNKSASGIGAYLAPLDFPAKLYTSSSDNNGNILFELKHYIGPKEITLQTNHLIDSTYKFELTSPFSKQFSQTSVSPFFFDKTREKELLTRSINMQTGNSFVPRAFVEKKAVLTDSLAFFGLPDEKYFLDDYTRFPTMEEVLREYVRGVMVRRRNKSFHFRMIDKVIPNTFYRTDPLVLLDGIPIFNIDKFMEIDPLKIKKVELMSSRYYLGMLQFTGIVSFSTYKNDLAGFELDPKVLVIPYDGVQAEREFYAPKYDNQAAMSGRMPDFRNLMHWSPNVTTDENGKAQIQFFTSDQIGNYKVVVQGISNNGVAGSSTTSFNVGKRSL
ncbi:hypothetical protein [Dyadobacter sp. CY312]|uniref:hypothetical protein n=1 Tax=Dyadobacter sp. CY312 TaxID=2907303 RepID=UPI001F3F27B9|nr:hypothetical protein [Dyadobacter sp. CY312]MCE7041120.1 hypothetical protein [Dyadobacter sp. CY312]